MARGLGKGSAIRGASGRESMYAPSDPYEVMTVRSRTAWIGGSNDPTRMFYREYGASRSVIEDFSRSRRLPLTRMRAPGILHECFHMPVNINTATVCHQPVVLEFMYVRISAERIWRSGTCFGSE